VAVGVGAFLCVVLATCLIAGLWDGASAVKTRFEIVESAAKTLAIAVGGWWTYGLFVRNRKGLPHASLSHVVSNCGHSDGRVLVRVTVIVKNIGEVLLDLKSADVRIAQVSPVPENVASALRGNQDPVEKGKVEVAWPPLSAARVLSYATDRAEVEPGESQTLFFDFAVPSEVRIIEVYSYVTNEAKRHKEIGWRCVTMNAIDPSRIELCVPREDESREKGSSS